MSTIVAAPWSALVVAAFAAIALSGCAVSLDLGDDVEERTETDAVDATGIRRIEVATANGRITVADGTSDEVELTTVLRESRDGDAEYTVERHGDRLLIAGECDGRGFDGCSVSFDVAVPAGVDVAAETDNGRIDLTGLPGAVDAATDNGAITGRELAAATVRTRTDNGRIELLFAEPPDEVDAGSDNGAIAVRIPDDGGAYVVEASSDNGAVDVDVRVDPTAQRTIAAESDNGAIDIEYRR